MPEYKTLGSVLLDQIDAQFKESTFVHLSSQAEHIFDVKLNRLDFFPEVGKDVVLIRASANISAAYIERESMALKFFQHNWEFVLLPKSKITDFEGEYIVKLLPDSLIHAALADAETIICAAQLHLLISLVKDETFEYHRFTQKQPDRGHGTTTQPLKEHPAFQPAKEITVQVTPEQTHVVPGLGTIHIEVD